MRFRSVNGILVHKLVQVPVGKYLNFCHRVWLSIAECYHSGKTTCPFESSLREIYPPNRLSKRHLNTLLQDDSM